MRSKLRLVHLKSGCIAVNSVCHKSTSWKLFLEAMPILFFFSIAMRLVLTMLSIISFDHVR